MIRYFASHPTAANLIMAGILIIGMFAAPSLLRESFPRIDPRRVEVSIPYPGARPEEVEQAICQRIEDVLESVNNVTEIACEAREGLARAVIEMTEGNNLDRFFADVKTEIDAISDFPDKVEQPVIRQLGRSDFVATVAVTGPQNRADLKAYAEDVKTRMLQWGGISRVTISGFAEHQIRIELADTTLRQFGLSVADIASMISRHSLDLPAGSLSTQQRDVLVRFADERKRIYEFLDMIVVSGDAGGQVRLGDIAKITERFDPEEDKVIFNGKPAALLKIYKTETEDTLLAIEAINTYITNENATAPPGVQLSLSRDGSSIVSDRLNLLIRNGTQGLGLVFLVLWLFFGLRYSFWVAMGLPVSFMGAIALMLVMGFSLNMLTMVGLLIAIGLLMDDAIVISENVAKQRQSGKEPLEAAVEGAKQVFPSILASFTTTACIFGSLAFLEGDLGTILKMVPIVMLFVLSISLIEAFLILPNHLYHSMGHGHFSNSKVQHAVDQFLENIKQGIVLPVVRKCVEWRYLAVGCAAGIFMLAVSLMAGGVIGFSAFPELEGDTIEARLLLPQGTPLAQSEQVVDHIAKALERINTKLSPEQPDGQQLVKNVTLEFNKNRDAFESGAHVATVTVDLLSAEVRHALAADIMNMWREEVGNLPDVISLKFSEAIVGPAGLPIDLRLEGIDPVALKSASLELQDWLRRYKGVSDVSDDFRPGKPEIRVHLKAGAASLGIDGKMIADQLRTAFYGSTVTEFQSGKEIIDVDVRLALDDKNSLADLDYFTITNPQGRQVPLSVVATLEEGRGYARINRINGFRTLTIQGNIDARIANANAIINDTMSKYIPKLLDKYPGVSMSLRGQNNEAAKTQKSMAQGFVLGLIGVYLLLSFQFHSYIEPLIVMVAIPLSLIGVFFGHYLMGLDVSMPSMLGFVSLAGVVVNNSILLLNFIKAERLIGTPILEASVLASGARFRAIFLTTLTTIVGLLPMMSETSLQAQVLIPLVTSLTFGLMASAILVLVIIPSIYVILDDFRSRRESELQTNE